MYLPIHTSANRPNKGKKKKPKKHIMTKPYLYQLAGVALVANSLVKRLPNYVIRKHEVHCISISIANCLAKQVAIMFNNTHAILLTSVSCLYVYFKYYV